MKVSQNVVQARGRSLYCAISSSPSDESPFASFFTLALDENCCWTTYSSCPPYFLQRSLQLRTQSEFYEGSPLQPKSVNFPSRKVPRALNLAVSKLWRVCQWLPYALLELKLTRMALSFQVLHSQFANDCLLWLVKTLLLLTSSRHHTKWSEASRSVSYVIKEKMIHQNVVHNWLVVREVC